MANFDIKAIISAVDATGPGIKSAQKSMNDLATLARRVAATIGVAFGTREVLDSADAYASLQARLKLASRSVEEFAAANAAVERIARAAQAPLLETATLYTRIASSLKDTSVSQAAFVDTTEAVALSLRISGGRTAEAQSTMLQFSQAIASGVLRGEEFNAVNEASPRLLQALAQSLGKPVGELRELAKQGALTRDVLIDGLARQLPTLRKEAESLPLTFGAALTDLRNTLVLTVGQIDQATGASSGLAKSLLDIGKPAILTAFQAIAVLGANVVFVFRTIGREIGARAAQLAALARLDFKGAAFIGQAVAEDSRQARAELDALEKRILGLGAAGKKAATDTAKGAATAPTKPAQPQGGTDKSALRAAQQEAAALLKAREALDKARAEADAQGLEDSLTARREKLEQSRKAELIDEAAFIAAKAALDEEGLRNELAALQAQQAALRAAASAQGAKGSERTQALADLALVDARIQSAADKILNLNQAATADLAALAAEQLRTQAEFLDGLEQEAFLSGLNNDERETALLLLQAEKLGITDINRLLELQGQIRANANAAQAAEALARQQDDLYQSVQQGVQQAFADGLNAVSTGEGGVAGALKNLVDTIRNALSNAIAGSFTEAFLGALGGKEGVLNIAGSLGFGGKKDGSTPATAIYVQDVNSAAAGAAGGAESGGLFSGLSTLLGNLMSVLRSAFSSLVSSIGSALSGLGGGGGQNLLGGIASLFGFASGGYTGDGGKYEPKGIVHGGEFVFSKAAVSRLGVAALANLHNIASGAAIPRGPRLAYADGGLVDLPAAAAPTVNASTRIINHVNLDSAMADYLTTRAGERAILNIIQRNPGAVGA